MFTLGGRVHILAGTHLFPKLPHQNLAFSFFSLEYTVSEYHTVLCRCSSTNCAQLMYSLNFLRPIKFGLFFPGEETFEAAARSSFRTAACNRAKNVGALLLLPDLQSELLRFACSPSQSYKLSYKGVADIYLGRRVMLQGKFSPGQVVQCPVKLTQD